MKIEILLITFLVMLPISCYGEENTFSYWLDKGDHIVMYGGGSNEEALYAFDMAIKINPENATAWVRKGEVLLGFNKFDEAEKAYDKAIALDPRCLLAWEDKGRLLSFVQGRYDEAAECFDKVIELRPKDPQYWVLKGDALFYGGKYNESMKAYDEAFRIDPHSYLPMIWERKGDMFAQQKNYDKALESYNKAMELNPNDSSIMSAIAYTLYNQGSYIDAVDAFDKALEMSDGSLDGSLWYFKSKALETLGRKNESEEAHEKAKELGYLGWG
jgi:tetratricopeptide (TPR) repeat protein